MGEPLRILFACVGNSARSQMAEAFARALGGANVEAKSGGSRPAGHVHPDALAAMREKGIDMAGHRSKPIDEDFARRADLIVTMGCGDDACPAFIGRLLVDWDLTDPAGAGLEVTRSVRDDIERRVRDLLTQHGLPLTPP